MKQYICPRCGGTNHTEFSTPGLEEYFWCKDCQTDYEKKGCDYISTNP